MAIEAQQKLSTLRKSCLVRDDSGPFRVYRDDAGSTFHSVTHILKETAPEWQQKALERWLARPGSEQDRDTAATRGTLAHNHAEYILKTGAQLARKAANKRNVWKSHSDGLERCPGSITSWGIERAIQGAPRVPWSAAGYARGLRGWIGKNVTAIHAVEFSIHHPAGFAGTCDALLDIQGKGPVVVDWKTSQRERSEEMLTNYIDQLGAYATRTSPTSYIRVFRNQRYPFRTPGAAHLNTKHTKPVPTSAMSQPRTTAHRHTGHTHTDATRRSSSNLIRST